MAAILELVTLVEGKFCPHVGACSHLVLQCEHSSDSRGERPNTSTEIHADYKTHDTETTKEDTEGLTCW